MTAFPKHRRHVDSELLEAVRQLPCMACASLDPHGAYEAIHDHGIRSHPHHVVSRGHGGGDVAQNVMPLCVTHHQVIHRMGLTWMANKFQVIQDWLLEAGWEVSQVSWDAPACVYGRADGQN